MVLEKTVESSLDCEEIQPVHPKGNQSWIVTGRTDAEAEAPGLWPPDGKNWFIGKDPDAGKDWRKRRRGPQRMRWHHQLNGHEFEQTPEDRRGFPLAQTVKNPLVNIGDVDSIPGSGRFTEGGNGNPLQYSCLGNPMDRGAWQALKRVHGITKSWTWLSDWTTTDTGRTIS